MKKSIVITDYGFPDIDHEKSTFASMGFEVVAGHCTSEDEVLNISRNANAILVQWAPVTRRVIENLNHCEVIVRYGIGVDNVDLKAAKEKGIPVCNVPDYCIQEVADHTIALAFSLARQLKATERRIHLGVWKITPPLPLPPFREMVFGTMGYGRIAREVLKRARAFGFKLAAYDPFIKDEVMLSDGVTSLSKNQLLKESDIISLHLPLNEETAHLINENTLALLKPHAFIINTARGGLVDNDALAKALNKQQLGGAGLDVFEKEPLPENYPLMQCENAILTSHTAWYSASSVPVLQRMATEEVIRALNGKPLKNRVA